MTADEYIAIMTSGDPTQAVTMPGRGIEGDPASQGGGGSGSGMNPFWWLGEDPLAGSVPLANLTAPATTGALTSLSPLATSSYGALGTEAPAAISGALGPSISTAGGAGGFLGGLGSFLGSTTGLGYMGLGLNILGGLLGGGDDGERESYRGGPADPEVALGNAMKMIPASMMDITTRMGQDIPAQGLPGPTQIEGLPFSLGEGIEGGLAGVPPSALMEVLMSILNGSELNGGRSRGDRPITGHAVPRGAAAADLGMLPTRPMEPGSETGGAAVRRRR